VSKAVSEIPTYLRLLAKHGELIDEVYRARTVRGEGDNAFAISELQAARVLITTGEGEYRLETGIKLLLDKFTQRQRSFAVGQNISGEIESLRELLIAYDKAIFSGTAEDRDRLLDDIHHSIGAIYDTISNDLLRFQQATEVNFSTLISPREKAQQNEYFLRKAQELEKTLGSLMDESMNALFDSDVLLDVKTLFRREVESHVGEWSDRLLRTIDILQKYLYRHREVTEATRRLRSFGSFLKKNTIKVVEDVLEGGAGSEDLVILRQVGGDVVPPYPDFISSDGKERLIPVVQKMEPLEVRDVKARKSGLRARDGDMIEVEEILSPEEEALSVFLAQVKSSGGWVSASVAVGIFPSLDLTDFLEEIINWSSSGEQENFQLHPIFTADRRKKEANVEMEDVEVCLVV
jgi:hypothetical protein